MAARGLGKGLDSLFPKTVVEEEKKVPDKKKNDENGPETMVKITKVEPNRNQPRKSFDEASLEELANSIKQFGILQPILVQEREDYYEIIGGERRWRAAKLAGLKEVPVIIKNYTEQEIAEISIIENIQREDLNPIEEAQAFKRLLTEFNLKQDEVAERVSKSRTAVTNSMRLLKLPEEIQQMLIEEKLSTGHARAILSIEDNEEQLKIANKICKDKLSVREVEKLIKNIGKPEKEKKQKDKTLMAIYENLEEQLKQKLSTKVSISPKDGGAGKMEIEFYSHEDLDRIIDIINR